MVEQSDGSRSVQQPASDPKPAIPPVAWHSTEVAGAKCGNPNASATFSWRTFKAMVARTTCCAAVVFATLPAAQPNSHIDLYPTYVAAHFANQGRWDHIYHRSIWLYGDTDTEWNQRARELVGLIVGTSFVYHPWYLSAIRPIAANVSYETFRRGWVWMNNTCIVLVGLGLALLLDWHSLTGQLLLTLLVKAASPTLYGIDLGQNVLPALALCLAAVAAWQSRAPLFLGGIFAALAWVCKPWCSMVLVLCFLLRGVRSGVLTSVSLAAGMFLLPLLVMPDVLMDDYSAMNKALARVSVDGWNNLSVLSIIERASSSDWSLHLLEWLPREATVAHRGGALVATATVLAIGVLLWWRKRPANAWTVAAWLAFMLMPLNVCWAHYFIFAFPLAFMTSFSKQSPAVLRAAGLCLLVLLMAMVVIYDVPPAEYQAYLKNPAGYPWLRALPMTLLACVSLLALGLAPKYSTPKIRLN